MGQAGLGSRGSGTCVGGLVPVLHRHDGGFAEEAVLIVHQVLVNAGFNIRILGTNHYLSGSTLKVVAQSVPAGTEMPRGSVIEVTFRYLETSD